MENKIHIGRIITQSIEQKGMTRSDIGRIMGRDNTNIYAFEKRDSINSINILKLCHALKHNLFRDIAEQLPADYTTASVSPLEKVIAEQAEQIKKLQWENDLMKELNAKRG